MSEFKESQLKRMELPEWMEKLNSNEIRSMNIINIFLEEHESGVGEKEGIDFLATKFDNKDKFKNRSDISDTDKKLYLKRFAARDVLKYSIWTRIDFQSASTKKSYTTLAENINISIEKKNKADKLRGKDKLPTLSYDLIKSIWFISTLIGNIESDPRTFKDKTKSIAYQLKKIYDLDLTIPDEILEDMQTRIDAVAIFAPEEEKDGKKQKQSFSIQWYFDDKLSADNLDAKNDYEARVEANFEEIPKDLISKFWNIGTAIENIESNKKDFDKLSEAHKVDKINIKNNNINFDGEIKKILDNLDKLLESGVKIPDKIQKDMQERINSAAPDGKKFSIQDYSNHSYALMAIDSGTDTNNIQIDDLSKLTRITFKYANTNFEGEDLSSLNDAYNDLNSTVNKEINEIIKYNKGNEKHKISSNILAQIRNDVDGIHNSEKEKDNKDGINDEIKEKSALLISKELKNMNAIIESFQLSIDWCKMGDINELSLEQMLSKLNEINKFNELKKSFVDTNFNSLDKINKWLLSDTQIQNLDNIKAFKLSISESTNKDVASIEKKESSIKNMTILDFVGKRKNLSPDIADFFSNRTTESSKMVNAFIQQYNLNNTNKINWNKILTSWFLDMSDVRKDAFSWYIAQWVVAHIYEKTNPIKTKNSAITINGESYPEIDRDVFDDAYYAAINKKINDYRKDIFPSLYTDIKASPLMLEQDYVLTGDWSDTKWFWWTEWSFGAQTTQLWSSLKWEKGLDKRSKKSWEIYWLTWQKDMSLSFISDGVNRAWVKISVDIDWVWKAYLKTKKLGSNLLSLDLSDIPSNYKNAITSDGTGIVINSDILKKKPNIKYTIESNWSWDSRDEVFTTVSTNWTLDIAGGMVDGWNKAFGSGQYKMNANFSAWAVNSLESYLDRLPNWRKLKINLSAWVDSDNVGENLIKSCDAASSKMINKLRSYNMTELNSILEEIDKRIEDSNIKSWNKYLVKARLLSGVSSFVIGLDKKYNKDKFASMIAQLDFNIGSLIQWESEKEKEKDRFFNIKFK